MDTPEFSPETTKRRRKRINRGNFIVRSVQDFVTFVKELNKVTEGILFFASGFLVKKGWDYLYKLYEDRYKARNLIVDMNRYMKKFDEETDEAKKSIYRQKLTAHNAVYFALLNKDYVTDPKYLLEPKKASEAGNIFRGPKRVTFDSDILADELDDIQRLTKDPKLTRAAFNRIVRQKDAKGVTFGNIAFGFGKRRRSYKRRTRKSARKRKSVRSRRRRRSRR